MIYCRCRVTLAWTTVLCKSSLQPGSTHREKTWVNDTSPCLPCETELMMEGCVHFQYNSSWKFNQLAVGHLLSGQPVQDGRGSRYGPPITYRITPFGSLSSSQPGRLSCCASPLTFGLTGYIIHQQIHCPPLKHTPPVPHRQFFFSMHHSDSFGNFLHSHCALPYSVIVP